jgi:DNA-binding XRE family transcriptional regulator
MIKSQNFSFVNVVNSGELTMENKAIYTTKETAAYLGVSPSTIYRMEKRGLLSLIKLIF